LSGIDLRGLQIDSGAARVTCSLPRPRGSVPIHISSGVVAVELHRPTDAEVVVDVSTGTAKLQLDEFNLRTIAADAHWETSGAGRSRDRYDIRISSGVVKVSIDMRAALDSPAPGAPPGLRPEVDLRTGLELVLDGIESRLKALSERDRPQR
ncbi:MAG: hypothetical protein ACRENM_07730, partial [Candidatus Dormibacteraceae bacterium]